jgi:dienelactone hydrolase
MKPIILSVTLPLLALGLAASAAAEVHSWTYAYQDGDAPLEGYVAYDSSGTVKKPGVLVVHEWMGLDAYARSRADQLAKLGYVAFAADIYGKGIRPATTEEAAAQAAIYRADRKLMRSRITAALTELRRQPGVDPAKIAVIGYCFGGGVALELARSGADILGAASFHGNLDTPSPDDAKNIKGKVIAFHGADDPYVSTGTVADFQAEMRSAGVDWQMNIYGGAVHRFSNPSAGSDVKSGAAYNEKADRRSWAALQAFFAEIFR